MPQIRYIISRPDFIVKHVAMEPEKRLGMSSDIIVHGATLSRRQFVKTGGALFVGISVAGAILWEEPVTAAATTLDPTLASSWFEIHADSTILMASRLRRRPIVNWPQTSSTSHSMRSRPWSPA